MLESGGGRESSQRNSVELVSKDDLGPSGRPDATGIPGSGTCKGKAMYVQGEEMVKTVGGDSRGGGVGTQGDEEGLIRWTQASVGAFLHQHDALALSCLIHKGFEGAKCELYSKVIEE